MPGYAIEVYKGKRIVVVDVSNTGKGEARPILEDARERISALPAKSALILTDVKDATYNTESSSAIKEFSSKITPYVKASAVVGAEGMRAVLIKIIANLTKREIKDFEEREAAMDWLVRH